MLQTKNMANQTIAEKRKILNISLPAKLYFEVEKLAKKESKTKAELSRELLRQYIDEEKRWSEIRALGRATAKEFGIKNEDDVERIIDEIRQ